VKDFGRGELEASRPEVGARHAVEFCLTQLYADEEHCTENAVVRGLTFEELIGALLSARDVLDRYGE